MDSVAEKFRFWVRAFLQSPLILLYTMYQQKESLEPVAGSYAFQPLKIARFAS